MTFGGSVFPTCQREQARQDDARRAFREGNCKSERRNLAGKPYLIRIIESAIGIVIVGKSDTRSTG